MVDTIDPIVTAPISRPRQFFIEDLEAGGAEARGASLEQSLVEGPFISALRSQKLAEAEGRPLSGIATRILRTTPFGQLFTPELERDLAAQMKLSPFVQPDEANRRAKELDLPLKFEAPIREEALRILIRRKQEELARKSILSRAPDGFFSQAGIVAAGLLGSVIDPLNLASAFIPVVGEARMAALVGRYGVTGARFARGGIEGAVGAAVVEPLVLGVATEEQADYGYMNSLLNLAFGTVLGAGLHVGGGAIADAVARRRGVPTLGERLRAMDPAIHEKVGRAAVTQTATGRAIDLEPIARQDTRWHDINGPPEPTSAARFMPIDYQPTRAQLDLVQAVRTGKIEAAEGQRLVDFLKSKGGIREEDAFRGELATRGITARRRPGLIRKEGLTLDDAALAAQEAGFFPNRPVGPGAVDFERIQVGEFLDALREDVDGLAPRRNADNAEIQNRNDTVRETAAFLERNGIRAADFSDRELAFIVENLQEGRADLILDFERQLELDRIARRDEAILGDDHDAWIARQDDPSADLAASEFGSDYARRAADLADEDPKLSFDEVKAEFEALAALDPEMKARLDRMADIDAQTKDYTKAMRAFGACQARG